MRLTKKNVSKTNEKETTLSGMECFRKEKEKIP